jgi:hypothetical protein
MFGHRSGVQANTKLFLFMVLTFMVLIGRIPRFTCDNNLATFINVEKEKLTLEEMTQLMVEKFKLIANMHSYVLENVNQAHKKQHRSYVERKGKQEFVGFEEGKTMVKMKKLGKRRALLANWEGPYAFMKYKDKKGYRKFDDGS